MKFGVFPVQGCKNDAAFSKRNPLRAACFFCMGEKSLEGYPVVRVSVFMKGESEIIRKQSNAISNT